MDTGVNRCHMLSISHAVYCWCSGLALLGSQGILIGAGRWLFPWCWMKAPPMSFQPPPFPSPSLGLLWKMLGWVGKAVRSWGCNQDVISPGHQ